MPFSSAATIVSFLLLLWGSTQPGSLVASQESDGNGFPPTPSHDWRAPSSTDVRSPCPFINTLANHGYINRSGKDVDLFEMVNQLVVNFDVAPPLFLKLAAGAIDLNFTTTTEDGVVVLDIDVLNTHNKQEHDASFVRADHYFGNGELVDPDLLRGFINETSPESNALTKGDIMEYQTSRIQHSKDNNPEVKLVEKQTTSFSAQATLWLVFGQQPELESVSKDRLHEFLLYERFPVGYIPSRLNPAINDTFIPHDVIQPDTLAGDIRGEFADNFVSLLPPSSATTPQEEEEKEEDVKEEEDMAADEPTTASDNDADDTDAEDSAAGPPPPLSSSGGFAALEPSSCIPFWKLLMTVVMGLVVVVVPVAV